MIKIKSEEEIELIRQSSLLVGKTLAEVAKHIKPGVKTIELDEIAEKFILDNGALPGFKGMYGYKHTLCISVNSQVVHGIPGEYELKDGDVVSVDCGVLKNGYYGDVAYTFAVGEVSPEVKKLLDVTKECLTFAIEKAIAGNRIGDIGSAVQEHAEKNGYGVVRELVGHGLGKNLHEEPEVPNYGRKGNGIKLVEGMVLAIEPMINMGTKNVKHEKDGWTITTADGKPSAHYEHDVVVRKGKAEVLSSYEEIEEVLKTINK
jgi:methionyl aminopeptidase